MPVHYLASRGGGAENQIGILMETLIKKRYEIHFLSRRIPNIKVKTHRIWRIGSEEGLGKYWTFLDAKRIYNTLKEIKPDLIYQNVGCAYTGVAAWYVNHYKSKLIWHIASDVDVQSELSGNLKKRILNSIDRLFLNYGIRNADIIVGQTRYQNGVLKARYGRECQAYIPIGHPLPREINKNKSKIKVLWVASVKPLKQPEVFVKMARMLANIPNVEFVMMGHANTDKYATAVLKDIKLLPNLEYIGCVPQEEVNRQMSEGHILVNTSRYEGFSNTFVQAWLRKVPVVSLNVDPDGILVREGIGFRSRTFDQLCQDVRSLITDSTLREGMGERAKSYALEHHTVENMAGSLISLFDAV